MSTPQFRNRLTPVTFNPALFQVHRHAAAAHAVWDSAVDRDRTHFPDCLLTSDALAAALRCTPLPVIEDGTRETKYGVVGRFHIYCQLTAYARNEILKPLKAALLIIRPPDGRTWTSGLVETLSQSLLILDNCGRAKPVDEYRAIYNASRSSGWRSLRNARPSRNEMASRLELNPAQLR